MRFFAADAQRYIQPRALAIRKTQDMLFIESILADQLDESAAAEDALAKVVAGFFVQHEVLGKLAAYGRDNPPAVF